MDKDALAQPLAAEKADAAERIASLTDDLDSLIQSSVGANADDEHDPEGATIAFERAQLTALLASSRRRLADLHPGHRPARRRRLRPLRILR